MNDSLTDVIPPLYIPHTEAKAPQPSFCRSDARTGGEGVSSKQHATPTMRYAGRGRVSMYHESDSRDDAQTQHPAPCQAGGQSGQQEGDEEPEEDAEVDEQLSKGHQAASLPVWRHLSDVERREGEAKTNSYASDDTADNEEGVVRCKGHEQSA